MRRKLLVAFVLAAPIGALLGFAAALLPPTLAAAAFDMFLACAIVGALGLVIAFRPSQRSVARTTSSSVAAGLIA
ncbi:MAG: hypothetical protein GC190_06900 [Alphaproteobacteria bacterium]|nr:hypothetical protein [Alphaproteobacteria bacterium]